MKDNSFQAAIKSYLDERAKADELFARLITKKTRVLMNAAAISWEKRKRGATRLPSLMRRYSAWRFTITMRIISK